MPTSEKQTIARRFEVRNLADGQAEVYLYDAIGECYGGVAAKDFINEVGAKAAGATTLNLYINSPGGSVYDADAIVNFLNRHPASKVAHVDGLAASAACTIAMACPVRNMAQNAMMMVHRVADFTFGNADEMRKTADIVDKLDKSVCAAYAAATGQTPEKCRQLMDEETWMDAEEAKGLNFATAITGEKTAAAVAGFTAANLAKFHTKHPDKLAALVSAENHVPAPAPAKEKEPEMAKETKPGTEAGGATAEPINMAEYVKTEGKRFTEAFGAENGAKYFTAGMTFEAAQTQNLTDLKAANKAQADEIAALKTRLDAANKALGTDPLSADPSDPAPADPKNTAEDSKRLAGFEKICKGDKTKAANMLANWKANQAKKAK
jgi:ATP-dependent protease ClpP protease subunit